MQDLTLARVHKNGSSNAVVIPRQICKALQIDRGDQLILGVARGGIITLRKLTDANKLKIIKF